MVTEPVSAVEHVENLGLPNPRGGGERVPVQTEPPRSIRASVVDDLGGTVQAAVEVDSVAGHAPVQILT